jgi:hypothetical protein
MSVNAAIDKAPAELRAAFESSTYIEVGHHLLWLCPLCLFRDGIVVIYSAIIMSGRLPNRRDAVHLQWWKGRRPEFDE